MDTATFGIRQVTFRPISLIVLLYSSVGASLAMECEKYGIKNSDTDGEGEWELLNFQGKCSICFRREGNVHKADLVLPYINQQQQPITKIVVSYAFLYQSKSNGNRDEQPLSHRAISCDTAGEENCCSRTPLERRNDSRFRLRGERQNRTITIRREDHSECLILYLKPVVSAICLTEVELVDETKQTTTTSTSSSPNGHQMTAFVSDAEQTTSSTGTGSLSTENHNTSVGGTEEEISTSSRSSHNNNQQTPSGQRRSGFPIEVIFVVVAIAISICVITGIFIRLRSRRDHQSAQNVSTDRDNGQSNGLRYNTKGDNGPIPNLNHGVGVETVNDKEGEYHSYAEIVAKTPNSNEMIYNSAYESTPANSDMVYNCAYGSQEISGDMIYNSAYESSASN